MAYRDQRIDAALLASAPGGIDLNPSILNLQTDGAMINLNLPANLPSLQSLQIDGFVPVIFQIVPTTNLQFLLGESNKEQSQRKLSRL